MAEIPEAETVAEITAAAKALPTEQLLTMY